MNGQCRTFQERYSKACPVMIEDGATAFAGENSFFNKVNC
jgi:hypothetical protein